ncbi:hypothetical protein EDD15DRAFT_112034 [Pisolithus albus]|nr:hypothetical protein EDD15DRAFT_112034 [Pisolithus albus]
MMRTRILDGEVWRQRPFELPRSFSAPSLALDTMSAQPLQVSYIELQGTGDTIESIEVVYDDHRLSIPRRGEHHFHEDFNQPLTIQGETISISVVRRRKLRIGPKQAPETVCNRLDITIGLSPSNLPPNASPGKNANAPRPTTEELLNECPRFRILAVGQPGVGKSTLINRTFGIERASAENSEPGKASIEKELISQQNGRFVLHDSAGFEPADNVECNSVKSFIEKRKKREHVKDQLHAVWLCFQIPMTSHEHRLLDEVVETFLKEDIVVLQNIPTIVVFTKYDKLVSHMAMQNKADPDMAAKEYLQERCIDPIAKITGSTHLSYVAVSSNAGYERGRSQLIELTHKRVTAAFGSQPGALSSVSVVTQMAQRVSPSLKVEGLIAVGAQRYWRAPTDYTVFECLAAIHTDIVCVWNFNDPSQVSVTQLITTLIL